MTKTHIKICRKLLQKSEIIERKNGGFCEESESIQDRLFWYLCKNNISIDNFYKFVLCK